MAKASDTAPSGGGHVWRLAGWRLSREATETGGRNGLASCSSAMWGLSFEAQTLDFPHLGTKAIVKTQEQGRASKEGVKQSAFLSQL